ncbi:MAG: cyclophilin-like fold protein [Tessaracoccus sp.]
MSIRKRWLSAITIASIALSACSQTTTSSDNGSPAEPTPSTSLSSTPPSSPSPTPFATADSSTAPPSQVTPSPTPTETSTTEDPEATMSETPIRIVIGDESLDTTLSDNPAARSLLEQLPLTLDFRDYGGQEVLATPPQPLTMKGMPRGESAPAGTIGYYAPDDVIVLYYTDVPRYNGIVRLGTINDDYSVLEGWSSPRSVTIELAG